MTEELAQRHLVGARFRRVDLSGATFDEVRLSAARFYEVDLTDEQLAGSTEPVRAPGWPKPGSFPVRELLAIVINEEWWHRQLAERDLDALHGRPSSDQP